ncbi:hypothetical protein O181_097996 [Austropuccinia psidii MF-1]|uniref:Uncharacterized protein n=1 Tax=Austropuccinia psidii MF-1 TaxID=1389203 RepID=A0A9Q3JA15_9BASI|nr:hypothetical protein [Austropuccinia psidii MF-1]
MVGCIVNSIILLHTILIILYLLITSYTVRYWHTNSVPDILEENYIPLATQSQANTPATPSEPEGREGKGKRHTEGLITAKKWTPISTQRNRKPRNFASIQGKPTLTTCTGKITIIIPVVTSKGKFPKSADNTLVQGTVKETLASEGTKKRTEKACPELEDLEEDTLDTVVHGKTLREIPPSLPLTCQFNRYIKPEDWRDMDQFLQPHQLLKELFKWRMDNKRFKLASHWEELGASCQKICLKEIDVKDLIVITKGWNSTRKFRLLEVRANRIRENQVTIQAIEQQLGQTGHTQIPSGSQGAGQISTPVTSHHSETNRSVAKSHHFSQSQEVSRRRQGYKGKNKTTLSQRKRESDSMIQKLLDLVKKCTRTRSSRKLL